MTKIEELEKRLIEIQAWYGSKSLAYEVVRAAIDAVREAEERADKDASDIEALVMERDAFEMMCAALRARCGDVEAITQVVGTMPATTTPYDWAAAISAWLLADEGAK